MNLVFFGCFWCRFVLGRAGVLVVVPFWLCQSVQGRGIDRSRSSRRKRFMHGCVRSGSNLFTLSLLQVFVPFEVPWLFFSLTVEMDTMNVAGKIKSQGGEGAVRTQRLMIHEKYLLKMLLI